MTPEQAMIFALNMDQELSLKRKTTTAEKLTIVSFAKILGKIQETNSLRNHVRKVFPWKVRRLILIRIVIQL